jgi:hypothetical protein
METIFSPFSPSPCSAMSLGGVLNVFRGWDSLLDSSGQVLRFILFRDI